jgi:hypothetical protein
MAVQKAKATPADSKAKKKKPEASFEFLKFQEDIKLEAFNNYQQRLKNNRPGNDMTDWLEAEKNVRSRNGLR